MTLARRPLGRTGLSVSELGLGCSSFWAKPQFPEREAVEVVEAALSAGINFFDTGPDYAAGEAERRLGLALRGVRVRSNVVVSSKVRGGASAAAVRESVARSLERLHLDALDVLHVHGPSLDDLRPELLQALDDLKREGLVRFVGINSFDERVVRAALREPFFDSFMIEYNVLNKRNATQVEAIAAAGRGVIAATPLAQALYEPDVLLPTSLKAGWEALRAVVRHRAELRAARRYRFLSELPEASGAQAALAFVLRQRAIACAVFGTTSTAHLAENIAAARLALPNEIVERIERLPDVRRA